MLAKGTAAGHLQSRPVNNTIWPASSVGVTAVPPMGCRVSMLFSLVTFLLLVIFLKLITFLLFRRLCWGRQAAELGGHHYCCQWRDWDHLRCIVYCSILLQRSSLKYTKSMKMLVFLMLSTWFWTDMCIRGSSLVLIRTTLKHWYNSTEAKVLTSI